MRVYKSSLKERKRVKMWRYNNRTAVARTRMLHKRKCIQSGRCVYCSKRAIKGRAHCKSCKVKKDGYAKKRYTRRRRQILALVHTRQQERREQVVVKYGGQCTCAGCIQRRPRFLTIDHTNHDGKQDRLTYSSTASLYRRLLREPVSPRYRLHCWSCNLAREGNKGICPYEGTRHW